MVRSRKKRAFSLSISGVTTPSRTSSVSHKASIHESTSRSAAGVKSPQAASSVLPKRRMWFKTLRRLASVGWAVSTGSMCMDSSSFLTAAGGHPLPAQFAERVAQRHGRARSLPVMRAQAANPLAFLTKINEMKKQAESMRDVRGLLHGKAIDRALLGLRAAWRQGWGFGEFAWRLSAGLQWPKTLPAPTARAPSRPAAWSGTALPVAIAHS